MKKLWLVLGVMIVLVGCNTTKSNSVPVVEASSPLSNKPTEVMESTSSTKTTDDSVAQAVPQGTTESIGAIPQAGEVNMIPTGIPASDNTIAVPLDGAVLALLTTAEQQQEAGNLNEAAASIERAQRIAPSEPRVLYNLAFIRLKQGDATAAEQLARRALSYTADDQVKLKSDLWEVVAQARELQGDQAGADLARQQKTTRI